MLPAQPDQGATIAFEILQAQWMLTLGQIAFNSIFRECTVVPLVQHGYPINPKAHAIVDGEGVGIGAG